MKNKIAVITLGCSKNQVDSEVMCGLLEQRYEITEDPAEADVILVNTCTFIEEAKKESIESILEMVDYKEKGTCKKLIVAGCMAQRYSKELREEIPEIDEIIGTGDVPNIIHILDQPGSHSLSSPQASAYIFDEKLPRKQLTPRHFAYVKIAEGCNHGCTFCVIPQVRGGFRSRTEASIVNEAEKLVEQGVREIMLIAQDTTCYGVDLHGEQRLPQLIRKLAAISELKWIRLLYCYPDFFSGQLIEAIKNEPKVCQYVDIPLQHADERVLKAMNRRGTAAKARALLAELRAAMPEITIRTTFITGFPGETEKEFQTLLAFVKEVEFDHLGVFAYSQEESTPAGQRKDQLPQEIRENRKEQLMQLQQEIVLRRQQRKLGKTLEVILDEKLPDGRWLGRGRGDAPEIDGQVYVTTKSRIVEPGEIVAVLIKEADCYDLLGDIVG
ncbi:MAG: 30S ribosomal protein S12 methylthiotransferase RimO [Peptococcaceae bacterium]|nr:30S ribosomal protein S12 methylthiotransferase RimO [Peptococcaceae bacterium]